MRKKNHGFSKKIQGRGHHKRGHKQKKSPWFSELIGRRGTRLERGETRYLILDTLAEKGRHGYEIMQSIQENTGGLYRPSPGTVYPTLQMLEDLDLISSQEEGNRKIYKLTETGRGELEELHLNARLMIVWGFLLSAVFGAALWLGQGTIIALFTHDPALVRAIAVIMPFVILLQAANGVNFVLDGVLMGVLDTRFLMIQLFIAGPLIFFPLAALAYHFSWGLVGLWSALAAFFGSRFVMNAWRFRSRTYVGSLPRANIR